MSDGLREALAELADDFASNVDWSAGRSNYGDNEAWESAARQIRALLAEHPATPAEEVAEVAVEEREVLADAIGAELYASLMEAGADQWRRWEFLTDAAKEQYRAEGARIVADAVLPVVAALTAKAKAEALREAADDLWGADVRGGIPAWLRERADREAR